MYRPGLVTSDVYVCFRLYVSARAGDIRCVRVFQAICIGQGWVAAATDSGCVRLFSVSGVQRDIVSLPGPVVAMASFDTQLMVVYHTAAGIGCFQLLTI